MAQRDEARDQRFVFGEVAERYDRLRPTFPDSLVRELAELAGLAGHSRVLEIGAGTGKLTRLLAPYGCEILALEPTPEMAVVLRRNCELAPVTVVESTFEAADLRASSFDLVTAAQSWHWVDANVREHKAARVLRPGGVLALVWNIGDVEAMAFHDEIDAVYARLAPELTHGSQTTGWQSSDDPRAALEAEGFSSISVSSHPWSRWLSTTDYVDLLTTHSHHRLLDPDVRARVLEEIAEVVDAHGGEIEELYDARLFTARRGS